jgi:hypothetical protein
VEKMSAGDAHRPPAHPRNLGLRAQAGRRGSADRKLLNDAYPELVEALSEAVRGDAVFDGEIVALDPERGSTKEWPPRRAPGPLQFPTSAPSRRLGELLYHHIHQQFNNWPLADRLGIASA